MTQLAAKATRLVAVEVDEDTLILAAQADRTAFDRLYSRYVDRVYRYLLSRTGRADEAQDLTSQVFVAALEGLPRYRHRGRFAAWLFSIARNKAADHFRRHGTETTLDLVPEQASPDIDLLAGAIEAEERQWLRDQISRLSPAEQDLLRLRFVADLSFGEMAVILAVRQDAVKKRVYRLLARLEDQLEASHD